MYLRSSWLPRGREAHTAAVETQGRDDATRTLTYMYTGMSCPLRWLSIYHDPSTGNLVSRGQCFRRDRATGMTILQYKSFPGAGSYVQTGPPGYRGHPSGVLEEVFT